MCLLTWSSEVNDTTLPSRCYKPPGHFHPRAIDTRPIRQRDLRAGPKKKLSVGELWFLRICKDSRESTMAWTEIPRRHYRREGLRYGSDTTDAEWFVSHFCRLHRRTGVGVRETCER